MFIFTGCGKPVLSQDNGSLKTIDSLKAIIVKDSVAIDTLTIKYKAYKAQRVSIDFARDKCHYYAEIVRKNPTQAKYITNWIDRQFARIKK